MIGQLTGKPISHTSDSLVIDVRGVGYKIFTSPKLHQQALQLSKLTNGLNSSLESFKNGDENNSTEEFPKDEDENDKSNEDDDIFTQIDKLETLANRNENIKKEPFKDMVTELRKTFDTIYKQVNVE